MPLNENARALYRNDAARWERLEDWYTDPAHKDQAAHLHQIEGLINRWHEVDRGEWFTDGGDVDETNLELNTAEAYAAEYGYELPPEHNQPIGDVVSRAVLGAEAQAIDDTATRATKDVSDFIDAKIDNLNAATHPFRDVPSWVYFAGAAAVAVLLVGAAVATNPAAVMLAASMRRGGSPPPDALTRPHAY